MYVIGSFRKIRKNDKRTIKMPQIQFKFKDCNNNRNKFSKNCAEIQHQELTQRLKKRKENKQKNL